MFILDSLLIDGLKFVMNKLLEIAEAELNDDTVLRERLLDAQMRLELGELSMDEFSEIEKDVGVEPLHPHGCMMSTSTGRVKRIVILWSAPGRRRSLASLGMTFPQRPLSGRASHNRTLPSLRAETKPLSLR